MGTDFTNAQSARFGTRSGSSFWRSRCRAVRRADAHYLRLRPPRRVRHHHRTGVNQPVHRERDQSTRPASIPWPALDRRHPAHHVAPASGNSVVRSHRLFGAVPLGHMGFKSLGTQAPGFGERLRGRQHLRASVSRFRAGPGNAKSDAAAQLGCSSRSHSARQGGHGQPRT